MKEKMQRPVDNILAWLVVAAIFMPAYSVISVLALAS